MKRLLLLYILVTTMLAAGAQSPHVSQFYSTPWLINPALTGYFDGPYRLASNFRSQWGGGSTPFRTISASAEVGLLKNRLAENNRLGLGASFLNDHTLGGASQWNIATLGTAYTVALDDEGMHRIGLGFQAIYQRRRLDYSRLLFENQLGSGGFDPSLPIGESLTTYDKGQFNAAVGGMYHYEGYEHSIFAGAAMFNVLRKKENLLPETFNISPRYTVTIGGQAFVGVAGTLFGSANYQYQSGAQELTIGGAYGLQLGDDLKNVISLGTWYRLGDALIPYVGYQLDGLQVGFSFDFTTSALKAASQSRNGFELSLVYSAPDRRDLKRAIPWY